ELAQAEDRRPRLAERPERLEFDDPPAGLEAEGFAESVAAVRQRRRLHLPVRPRLREGPERRLAGLAGGERALELVECRERAHGFASGRSAAGSAARGHSAIASCDSTQRTPFVFRAISTACCSASRSGTWPDSVTSRSRTAISTASGGKLR